MSDDITPRLVATARGKVWHIGFRITPYMALCGMRNTDRPRDGVTFERVCRRCQKAYDLECEQRRKAGVS